VYPARPQSVVAWITDVKHFCLYRRHADEFAPHPLGWAAGFPPRRCASGSAHLVQLTAQRLRQIPALIGAVGIQKITLVAYRFACLRRPVDIGEDVLAVGGQGNRGREAVCSGGQYADTSFGASSSARTKITTGSAFTHRHDLAALDQLRDQALRCSPGNVGVPGQEFGQRQSVFGRPDAV